MMRSTLFKIISALITTAVAMSATWCAAQNAPAAPNAAASQQTTFEIGDIYLRGSRVYVLVGKTGLGHEHGVTGQLKRGRISLSDPNNPGMLEFDMSSFDADTPDARKFVGLEGTSDASTRQQVNTNMRGPAVLALDRFPTSTFTIKQVAKLDKLSQRKLPQYQLSGDFTLHGVTRPIQITTEAEEQGGWTHLRGGFTMLQSQFGITPFTKAFGAIGVADQLTIWGDLWISKQRQIAARPAAPR